MTFLNLFSIRPILRELRGIHIALERTNLLKEAELRALGIDYPALHPVTGKEAEIEVMYTDPDVIEAEEHARRSGRIAVESE